MAERPQNAFEAQQLMLDWAEGKRSHQNTMFDVETDPARRQETLVRVAEADAAETAKWAAVYRAFAEELKP